MTSKRLYPSLILFMCFRRSRAQPLRRYPAKTVQEGSEALGTLKVAISAAFTGSIVGEFVAATRGLGHLLQFAQSTYNAALIIGSYSSSWHLS